MRLTFVIVMIPALIGCTMTMQSQSRLTQTQMNYNQQDDNECRMQGATVGTDPYYQCRNALARQHMDEEDAKAAERRAAEAAQANQQAYQPPPR